MDAKPHDLDALLAQAGWAKSLARSLVRDPDRADDLVQRAWLAALRDPPSGSTPPRRWLATVMRNFARDDARESSSREGRERAVARPERALGHDPFDDAAAAQARLLAAVRELPEPNRSAVWARYYDGLAPREIAQRDGVLVDTVKTRIARGLAQLRERFDREHGGDRGAWIAALMPLTRDAGAPFVPPDASVASAPLVASTLTTLVMDAKLKIAAVLALVVCGSVAWFATRDGAVSPGTEALAAPIALDLARPDERVDPATPAVSAGGARAVVDAAPTEQSAAVVAIAYREGVVLDVERRPVAGLAIVEGHGREPIVVDGVAVTSDAHGRFRVPHTLVGYAIAHGDGWVTVYATQRDLRDAREDLCVIVARARDLAGVVVDANGAPVAGASISHHVAEPIRRSLGEVLRGPVELGHPAQSDADGRFRIEGVPDVDAFLNASAVNRRTGSTTAPRGTPVDLVIVMPAPEVGSIVLRGRVIDERGEPVANATVGVGQESVSSASDGRFDLAVARTTLEELQRTTHDGRPPTEPMPLVLRAIAEDRLPARVELPALDELERIAPTEEYVLRLGGAPLAISGRVVDSDGAPVAQAVIALVHEDDFGSLEVDIGGTRIRGQISVERFLRGAFAAPQVMSDDDGRFTMGGLQRREYALFVSAHAIPAATRTSPIAAGATGVDVVIDTSGERARLAGRVVDRRGAPVANALVEVHVMLANVREPLIGPSARTGSDGAFEIAAVRGSEFRLAVSGSDIATTTLEARPPLDAIVVTATRRAYVQVDLAGREDYADSARFVDAAGADVQFDMSRTTIADLHSSSIQWSTSRLRIEAGRSETGSTAEGDYTCVLEKDGREVVRIPVTLGGESVTIVRP